LKIRPDTIIVNSPPLPVGLSGVILAKLVRARAIANVSDIWPLSALELGAIRKGWLYSLLEKIERWVYRLSDAVVCQSNETRQHVLERIPDKKTYLYRNLERISEYAHQYPAIGEQPVKIVYAGLLGVAQGVYDICRSIGFKEIGVEFHLYGHGNERSKIERYIADNPDCNVFLRDMVPKAELPKVLSQFHATIVPLRSNIHGAFPSKIYMAMSASLPVLFSGAGEGAAFVQESGIGWVSGPMNFAGLRENIQALSKMDSRDYEALRSRIKSLTTEQYDFEKQLARFVQFIDSI
jgi:glycosyltransferase involved in cell wall biosynthesis